MITVLVWITGLLGTLLLTVGGVVYLVVTLMDGRPWRIHVPAGMLCGYAAGALFVWNLAPSGWKLPLSTTLAASLNAGDRRFSRLTLQRTEAVRRRRRSEPGHGRPVPATCCESVK
jgi:hypothetical protein